MDKDINEGVDGYERLDAPLTEVDPADVPSDDENDITRKDRRLTSIIESIEPSDANQGDAVYSDTDMNPNADDQKDAHSGS